MSSLPDALASPTRWPAQHARTRTTTSRSWNGLVM
jgi:hypothetical protein